jgi:hypothetical protein
LSGKAAERAEGLEGWFSIAQVACIAKGWNADAGAIGIHGKKLAAETARVADGVEPIGKVLDMLSMTGPYAALMTAALPFAVQIAMNHKIIPETLALEGTQPPKALEAQVKAQIAVAQMHAINMQKEAEAQLAEAESMMKASRYAQDGAQ